MSVADDAFRSFDEGISSVVGNPIFLFFDGWKDVLYGILIDPCVFFDSGYKGDPAVIELVDIVIGKIAGIKDRELDVDIVCLNFIDRGTQR